MLQLQTTCRRDRHSHSVTVQDAEDASGPTEGWALQDDLVEQNAALKATVSDCRSKLSQADAQASLLTQQAACHAGLPTQGQTHSQADIAAFS